MDRSGLDPYLLASAEHKRKLLRRTKGGYAVRHQLRRMFLFQIDECRANAMMRGLPYPLHRGHCTSRSATRAETSGSRGFTRKSKSTTVPQLSQTITSQ